MTGTDNYLESVTAEMPGISPAAETIAQKVQNEKQEQNPTPEKVPSKLKKDGTPAKKRGRKPGNTAGNDTSRLGGVASARERADAADAAQRIAAAAFITDCMEMSGVALAGEAGKMNDLEKPGITAVWDKYLESKSMSDIPPGVMLLVMTGQYYARVLMAEQARPKVNILKEKIGGVFGKVFVRFKNARSMRRNDRKRKDNSGQEIGNGLPLEGDQSNYPRSAM